MPIYVYKASTMTACGHCRDQFEVMQKLREPPLAVCPDCGAAVKRLITAPHIASSGPSLSEDNIERHGFTQYRKLEKGVYEKTAGKGPDIISDDGKNS